ncbi:4Fe-4S dicluster domain-containing protein [Chloroflexota bacterium]
MSEKLLLIDVDKCVGCYACELACKQENKLPLESRWCVVNPVGPRRIQDEMHLDFVPSVCIQCADPICSYFCPFDAIVKRDDAIVIINHEKCTGCGICVYGCPYGAIYLDQEANIAGKCSLCAHRIEKGMEPACVQHCLSGALQSITREELDDITPGMHITTSGKVCYTSSKWKVLL